MTTMQGNLGYTIAASPPDIFPGRTYFLLAIGGRLVYNTNDN